MPRTLKFYGASDDLFEIEGTRGEEPDEIGCFDTPVTVKVATPDNEGLLITGLYAPSNAAGTWMVGISQLDEDFELPDWPMRWRAPGGRGYSVELEIEVPDTVAVSMP
ncbi:MAG: hypothetical protein AAF618_04990 [Pseudomonadota bacterium]